MSDSPITPTAGSVEVVDGAIDVQFAFDRFQRDVAAGAGATVQFVGSVREETAPDLGSLCSLDYHAYRDMATTHLERIAADTMAAHGLQSCLLWHSVGVVPVGEAAFVVCVAAPHRREALDGLNALIDRTKSEAPIWKREIWTAGERWKRVTDAISEGVAP